MSVGTTHGSGPEQEITPEGAHTLFHSLGLPAGWELFDLGSGLGKLVVQVHLDPELDAARVLGVELAGTRHAAAVEVLAELNRLVSAGEVARPAGKIELIQGDMLRTVFDVAPGTNVVVYLGSLCFDAEFMAKLGNVVAAESCVQTVLTLQTFADGLAGFSLVRTAKADMTWRKGQPV